MAIKNSSVNSNTSSTRAPFAVVESYKSIRTNLMFLLRKESGNVIAVSSANVGDGKSTTAVNIAIAFSQLGKKVLLIDADLRRSSIFKKVKLPNDVGISNIVAGFDKFEDTVKSVSEHLDVLVAGQNPPNPSELLGSQAFADLLEELKGRYNYIIIDTPPINVVSDTLVVSPLTDGLLLVVREKFTTKEELTRAISAAEFANIKILGAVMNGTDTKGSKRYKYRKYSYSGNKGNSNRY